MHLHVHVIPRYRGDVEDPRGGVRHVMPGKGNYLAPEAPSRPTRSAEDSRAGLDPAITAAHGDIAPREPSLATGGGDRFLRHIEPLFESATRISIVAAFVLETGLDVLEDHIDGALARGAHMRVITGNYLNVTQVGALRALLGWSTKGRLEARVVDMAGPARPGASFHPKSWRFEGPAKAVAFVGSSNISRTALGNGVEWNLRVERDRDLRAYHEIVEAFERLWKQSLPLTKEWIDSYELAVESAPRAVALAFAQAEAPAPHDVQIEALAALARSREEDHRRRAVVVLATGLGKTWLAAFDAAAYARANMGGRALRILFIAHREELLDQAAKTFRRMFRSQRARFGFFVGDKDELDQDIVFASVQKLSRNEHLARLAPEGFDYVIVDEVHHGAAQSYRAVLDRINPGFLLGLTATPDRADGADLLGLFDDHVAYRADIAAGIRRKLLVPFDYFGLKDDVDYKAIKWQTTDPGPPELVRQAIEASRAVARQLLAHRVDRFDVTRRWPDGLPAFSEIVKDERSEASIT
jgi:HKD family nuclease